MSAIFNILGKKRKQNPDDLVYQSTPIEEKPKTPHIVPPKDDDSNAIIQSKREDFSRIKSNTSSIFIIISKPEDIKTQTQGQSLLSRSLKKTKDEGKQKKAYTAEGQNLKAFERVSHKKYLKKMIGTESDAEDSESESEAETGDELRNFRGRRF